MTEQEADDAVSAAFETLDARKDLSDALGLFIHHGDRAAEHFRRALEGRDDECGRLFSTLLASELEWARSLRQVIEDHNKSVEGQ